MSAVPIPPVAPSPELEFVLRYARPRPSAAELGHAAALLRSGVRWDRLVQLAGWHRMLPLLHATLHALGWDGVPDEVREELRRVFVTNAQLSLRCTRTLLELLAELEAAGIPALPYKGPALAAQVYGSLALRQVGDLDVLVRRGDVLRARELLFARGYHPVHPLTPAALRFALRNRYHETLVHPTLVPVELHWAFTNVDIHFPLAMEDVLPHARKINLGGQSVRVFGHEDQLIILSVHGAKHRWRRVEWVRGFSELVTLAASEVDWDLALARARAARVEARFLFGLHLAAEVLGAPVPAEVARRAREAPHAQALEAEVWGLWERSRRPTESKRGVGVPLTWFQFRLSDGVMDKLRLLSYRATNSSQPEDWTPVDVGNVTVPPPRVLFRPFQVAARVAWYFRQRRATRATHSS
jgi:hypothetical protein